MRVRLLTVPDDIAKVMGVKNGHIYNARKTADGNFVVRDYFILKSEVEVVEDTPEVKDVRQQRDLWRSEYDRVVVERDEALRRMRVAQANAEARLQSAMAANERANKLQARIDDALRTLGSDEQVHGQMSLFDLLTPSQDDGKIDA